MSRPHTPENSSKILSVILAGGRGSRLHDLTHVEAKPALPAGPARLIDFTLANVVNSAIERAMVLTQFAPDTLRRHLNDAWHPVAAARNVALEALDGSEFGQFNGTADAVAKTAQAIDHYHPDHVIVLAGDHLYQMDYRPLVERHIRAGAEVTVGAVHVPIADAREFGVMALDGTGRIVRFQEKSSLPLPAADQPHHALASMGIYVFEWAFLRALLADLVPRPGDLDFGKHVLPHLVGRGTAHAYALPGRGGAAPFWRDLGTLDAYHAVHVDFANGRLPLDPAWPLVVDRRAMLTDWRGSFVGEGATIGEGALLNNVVVLPGARIGRNAIVEDAIVTGDALLPDGFRLDRALEGTPDWCTMSEGGIRVISASALQALGDTGGRCRQSGRARSNDNPAAQSTDRPEREMRAVPHR